MMNSPPPPPSSTCSDRANDKRRILVRSLLKSKLFGGLGFIFFLGLVLFQYSLSNLKAVVDDPNQHQFHKKEAVLKTQSRDSKYHSKKTSKWGELAKKSRQSSKKNQEKKKQGSAKKGGDDDREKEERGKKRDAMFPFQKPARRMAELYANELEFPFEQSMPGNTSEDIREPSPPYREIYILGVHHSATSIVSKAVLAMGAWGGLEGDLLLADPAKPARKQHKFFEQADLVALGDRAYAWCGVGRAGRRGAKAAREVAWEGFRGWEGRAPPPGGGGGESESESRGGGGGFAPPLWSGWGFDCERFLSEANRRQFRSEAAWLLKKYRHARDKHRRGKKI